MFVDDVGGVSINDALRCADGSAWMVEREGSAVEMTRTWLHYEAAVGVIRHFGSTSATWTPTARGRDAGGRHGLPRRHDRRDL
eukprot:1216638-Prymnesium_polylepis.1